MHRWLTPLMLIVVVLISGCAMLGPKNTIRDSTSSVVLLNRDLKRTLAVLDEESQKDDEGALFFQVKLRNLTNNEILHLQTKTIWLDANGMPLQDDAPWSTLTLTPQQEFSFTQTSTIHSAEYFTLKIRYLPPVVSETTYFD